MSKSELAARIAQDNPTLEDKKINLAIEALFDEITDALKGGRRIEIRGFGAFSVKEKPARTGRNPRTGEAVEISAKNVVHFRQGKELKERVNS
jgi:integration host factor subunit beta